MSFGFSIGDIVLLTQLAWKTAQNSRKACGEHDKLTQEVLSMHLVLEQLDWEIRRTDSPINNPENHRRKNLQTIAHGCREALNALDEILEKHNALSQQERGGRSLWQQVRFGNGDMAALGDMRERLIYHTSALNMFLMMATMSSMGRFEKQMVKGNGDLQNIKIAVDGIVGLLATKFQHEGSVFSARSDDDKAVWRDFRAELLKDGFRSSTLQKHKATIKAYIMELGGRGFLDEKEPRHSTGHETQLDIEASIGESPLGSGQRSIKSRVPRNAEQFGYGRGTTLLGPSACAEHDQNREAAARSGSLRDARQGRAEISATKSGHSGYANNDQAGEPAVENRGSRDAKPNQRSEATSSANAQRARFNVDTRTRSETVGQEHVRFQSPRVSKSRDDLREGIAPTSPRNARDILERDHESPPTFAELSGHASPARPAGMCDIHRTYRPDFRRCETFLSSVADALKRNVIPRHQWLDQESERLCQLMEIVVSQLKSRNQGLCTESLVIEARAMPEVLKTIVTRVMAYARLNEAILDYHHNIAPRCIAAATAMNPKPQRQGIEECDAIKRELRRRLDDLKGFRYGDDLTLKRRLDWLKADVESTLSALVITTQSKSGNWKWLDQRNTKEAIWSIWVGLEKGDRKSLNGMIHTVPDSGRAIILVRHEEHKLITSHHGGPYWYKDASALPDRALNNMTTSASCPRRLKIRLLGSQGTENSAKVGLGSIKTDTETLEAVCLLKNDHPGGPSTSERRGSSSNVVRLAVAALT